jgi:hypothetical protein
VVGILPVTRKKSRKTKRIIRKVRKNRKDTILLSKITIIISNYNGEDSTLKLNVVVCLGRSKSFRTSPGEQVVECGGSSLVVSICRIDNRSSAEWIDWACMLNK